MRLQVTYTVPLAVVVDLDRGRVERVVVIDEELDPAHGVHTTDYEAVADPDLSQRAIEIASDPAIDWPAWEVGW